MAKAKKSNDKARRKKLETHNVEFLPIPTKRLTPESAARWLEDDFPGFSELGQVGHIYAQRDGDREAFRQLDFSVSLMVTTCSQVIASGEPVALECELDPPAGGGAPPWDRILSALRVLSVVASIDGDGWESARIAAHTLALAAEGYAEAGAAHERDAFAERIEQVAREGGTGSLWEEFCREHGGADVAPIATA